MSARRPGCKESRCSSDRVQPVEAREGPSSRIAGADGMPGPDFRHPCTGRPAVSRAFRSQAIRPQSRPPQSKISKAAPVPTTTQAPAPEPVVEAAVAGTAKIVEPTTSKAATAARRSQSAPLAEAGALHFRSCRSCSGQPLFLYAQKERPPICPCTSQPITRTTRIKPSMPPIPTPPP